MLSKILLKCAEVAFTRHRSLFKSSRTLSQFLECQLQFSELLQSPESAPFKPHALLSLRQKEAVTFLPQEDVRAQLSVAVLRRACTGLLKVLSCRTFMGSLGVWPWYKISIFFRIVWDSFFLAKLIFEDFFLKRDNFSQLWHWVLPCQFLLWEVKLLLFTLSSLPHTSANQCPSMVATYEDLSLWIIQISTQNYVRVQRILKKLGVMCGV